MHSKQERKKKPINEPKKTQTKCEKKLKIFLNVVTLKKASFIYLAIQNNVVNATESRSFRSFRVTYGATICLVSRSQWVLPSVVQQPDNSPSTVKRCYIQVNRQKCSLRLTVKKFRGVSNLTISADLDGAPAPKEFLNWKKTFSCQKTLFLDNTVPYDLLCK